jgi:hypothetical protein
MGTAGSGIGNVCGRRRSTGLEASWQWGKAELIIAEVLFGALLDLVVAVSNAGVILANCKSRGGLPCCGDTRTNTGGGH